MRHHRRLLAAFAVAIVVSSGLTGAVVATAAPIIGRYVALGDSYASGPFIPNQSPNPIGCARSDHNYPSDLARALGVAHFTDVTCGGADTTNMTNAQSVPLGTNPPQFGALTTDTNLVTVTIGGNDIGFSSIVLTCARLSVTNPFGNPCQRHFTTGGVDQLAAAVNLTAPKIAAVLTGIRQRAPHARIVLVGYLNLLPPSRGCWPTVPVSAGDVPYLDGIANKLNAMLGAQAAAANDTFVNPGALTGHDACQPESRRWVEGIVPQSPSFPAHPNAAGMTEVATLVQSALKI